MTPNSTPPEGLCARESASGGESKDRDAEAKNGAQAGAESLDPRAVLLDTISTAINQAGFWLAIEGRHAIADAVLAIRDQEMNLLRRALNPDDLRMVDEMLDVHAKLRDRADLAHKARRTTAGYLDEIRAHLIRHGVDVEHLRHDGDVPIRLQELLDAVDFKGQP